MGPAMEWRENGITRLFLSYNEKENYFASFAAIHSYNGWNGVKNESSKLTINASTKTGKMFSLFL